jgi:hypothetical protein
MNPAQIKYFLETKYFKNIYLEAQVLRETKFSPPNDEKYKKIIPELHTRIENLKRQTNRKKRTTRQQN